MAKNDFQYGGWNCYTLQDGTIMTLISPRDCTLHVALESQQQIHQVAAPSNVIRNSEMRYHVIRVRHIGILYLVSILSISCTAVDVSLCTSLRNFIQIGPRSAEKNDIMSIFKMADLSYLGF